MKNKNILIDTFCPFPSSLPLIRDGGNMSTYNQKLPTRSIKKKTTHLNWMKNKNSIYFIFGPLFLKKKEKRRSHNLH
jgi:hypothetical protein